VTAVTAAPARHLRTAPAVLSCRGLRHGFDGHVVVDDVSFDVRAGEVYGLVGPAGSGKSTTVRLVCGLLEPDDGGVLLGGRPMAHLDRADLRRSVGYVAQSVVTLPSVTVAETAALRARFLGLTRAECADRTAEALAAVGLARWAEHRVDRCSGGVLRELSLAVTLLARPRLLVLDEPGAGIDQASRDRLIDTLGRLCDGGTAVLYATRHVDEADRLGARVGVLGADRPVARHQHHVHAPVA